MQGDDLYYFILIAWYITDKYVYLLCMRVRRYMIFCMRDYEFMIFYGFLSVIH